MEMKHRSVHCTTFSIISAQNALETALFQQVNSRIHRKHGPVYRYPQPQDWVRKSRHYSTCSSAGCLMRWCSLLKPHPAQSLTSYFTRCSHAWAWDPALYIYIPARRHACCMMKGGGCSGPVRLIHSQRREAWIAGYTAAWACLASPGKTSTGV